MMKTMTILTTILLSFNAFSITEAELASCPKSIQKEVEQASITVFELDETTKLSDDLINALGFSILGTLTNAPGCSALKGIAKRYVKIATELKQK